MPGGVACPKERPRSLDRVDRKRAEDAEYKRNAAIARKRDGGHCRICGRHFSLSTHHVEPRSLLRRSPKKHAIENLLTVCWGPKSCHEDLTSKVLKVYALSAAGTNGKMFVERWDAAQNGYVVAMPAA